MGRTSASWILGLSAVLWVATAGCGNNPIDCEPTFIVIDNPWGANAVTTSGGCTATCESSHADTDGAPTSRCVYVYVGPVAEGPCTIRIDTNLYAPIEAQVHVERISGTDCDGLYVRKDSAFEFTDAGTTDSAAE